MENGRFYEKWRRQRENGKRERKMITRKRTYDNISINKHKYIYATRTMVLMLLYSIMLGIVGCSRTSVTDTPLTSNDAMPLAGNTLSPPTHPAGSSKTSTQDGMVQLYVPASEFVMGSEEGIGDQAPVHTVYLDAYWIDQTEVTNEMYSRCVAEGACKLPKRMKGDTRDNDYYNPDFIAHPAVLVTWRDANNYCDWVGRRLPTEAEWEKAGRGIEGYRYPWGDEWDRTKLNYCDSSCPGIMRDDDDDYDDGYRTTAPVGSYPDGASPYGVLDMAGNVSEWVNDHYAPYYYEQSPYDNPQGPKYGSRRVIKGSPWDMTDYHLSVRGDGDPSGKDGTIGFRCVQDE